MYGIFTYILATFLGKCQGNIPYINECLGSVFVRSQSVYSPLLDR